MLPYRRNCPRNFKIHDGARVNFRPSQIFDCQICDPTVWFLLFLLGSLHGTTEQNPLDNLVAASVKRIIVFTALVEEDMGLETHTPPSSSLFTLIHQHTCNPQRETKLDHGCVQNARHLISSAK